MAVIVVTLVHGTWAPDAAWCLPESKLSSALQSVLGDDGVLETFRWSGKNTHYARLHASEELQRHVKDCHRRNGNHQHFLVAHSHGGTVCLYALRDGDARAHITGTVTISTPFVVCRWRGSGTPAAALMAFLLGTPVFLMLAYDGHSFSCLMAVVISVAAILLAGALILWLVRLYKRWRLPVAGELHESIQASFAFASLRTEELLIVRATGDEASGALAAAHMFGWPLAKLSRLLSALYVCGQWLERVPQNRTARVRWICALSLAATGVAIRCYANNSYGGLWPWFLGTLLMGAALDFGSRLIPRVRETGILPVFILSALVIQGIAGILVLPVIVLLSFLALPFGADAAALSTLFVFSVEASPPGSYNVIGALSDVSGMSHSAAYQDDKILAQIRDWIDLRRTAAIVP